MKTFMNISKIARSARIFLRVCFFTFLISYLANGLFTVTQGHWDGDAIESSENHEHGTEDENEGNKKETEKDDHLKLYYNYNFAFSSSGQQADGGFFIGGSVFLENFTPPPEHL